MHASGNGKSVIASAALDSQLLSRLQAFDEGAHCHASNTLLVRAASCNSGLWLPACTATCHAVADDQR
jgi:hypothetical protein